MSDLLAILGTRYPIIQGPIGRLNSPKMVADHVSIPIAAAGGISDSRGYRASLALGTQGVQIGTRFLAAEESPA